MAPHGAQPPTTSPQAPELEEAQRRELLADFAAADVRDLPTFTRGMDRLANDIACLRRRRLSVQQQQVV